MIILYITLWLLSGFLAAWLMHAVIDERSSDYTCTAVIALSCIGGIALFITLMIAIPITLSRTFKKLDKIVAFKAKEPK